MSPALKTRFIGAAMHLDLNQRAKVTQETLDSFIAHDFQWGKYDCGKMMIYQVRAMGHKISTGGTWDSPLALARFLRRHGGSGAACLDGWGLLRIPAAMVVVGDVVELAGGEPPFGAFGVYVGNGRVMAYHEDVAGLAILQPTEPYVAAWRL